MFWGLSVAAPLFSPGVNSTHLKRLGQHEKTRMGFFHGLAGLPGPADLTRFTAGAALPGNQVRHHQVSCVVILEDIVLLRKMPCNNWPQIVFRYLLILFGIYISIYKCKSSHSIESKAPPEHNSKLLPGRWCSTLRHPFFTSPSPDVESVICANFNL